MLWGEHIHHGYWLADEGPAEAQANLIHELARRAQVRADERVLDIGCGLGGSALLLAREYGARVHGITISPRQAAAAGREAVLRRLQDRVTFEVQDANCLADAPDDSFDMIWIVECSEHVFDKPRFFAACADRLKPGGRLAICAWLAGDSLNAAGHQLVDTVLRGMLCPSFGTRMDYHEWMERAGLVVIESEEITDRVQRTWTYCRPLLGTRLVRKLLASRAPRLLAFADSFAAIHDAYLTGAMAYGMMVAQKR